MKALDRKADVTTVVRQRLRGRHRVIVLAAVNRACESLEAGHSAHRAICAAMPRPVLVRRTGNA